MSFTFRHLFGSLLVASGTFACTSGQQDVRVDPRYAEHLTVASEQYEAAARTNAMSTVKVVQVYAPAEKGVIELREIRQGELLYEARIPSEVEPLFRALQAIGPRGECDLEDGPVAVVVAYDRDLPRAGVIRLYECTSAQGPLIGVRPVGDAAITYSPETMRQMRQLGLLR